MKSIMAGLGCTASFYLVLFGSMKLLFLLCKFHAIGCLLVNQDSLLGIVIVRVIDCLSYCNDGAMLLLF